MAAAVRAATSMRLPTAQGATRVSHSSKGALQCRLREHCEAAGVPEHAGGGYCGETSGCIGGPGRFDRQVCCTICHISTS